MKYIKSIMSGYDNRNLICYQNVKTKHQTFNQFLVYMFLKNTNKAKYGTLLLGLHTQTSLKNDQYPKTITKQAML
jgi:hypothetical protein